jgi:hypothetical protein
MDASQQFHHVILTRFNCSYSRDPADREIAIRARPGWLEERFVLFERYCLPSVVAQSTHDFRWHVYFDRNTPAQYLERARNGLAGRSNFMIKLCDLYGSETVQADLPGDLGSTRKWLVTTRLDNDDALYRDFVKQLHGQVRVGSKEALNFPWGIVYRNGALYLSRQESNSFVSVSEPFEGIQTVTCAPHNEIGRRFPVRDIGSGPAWMQVIHGSNVSNKVRGWRVARSKIPSGFEAIVGQNIAPEAGSDLGIAVENATLGVGRWVRDQFAEFWREKIARPPGVTSA